MTGVLISFYPPFLNNTHKTVLLENCASKVKIIISFRIKWTGSYTAPFFLELFINNFCGNKQTNNMLTFSDMRPFKTGKKKQNRPRLIQ